MQHAFNPSAAADEAPTAPDCPPPYYETTSPSGENPVYSTDYDTRSNGEGLCQIYFFFIKIVFCIICLDTIKKEY